jgi:hypothetical protein
MKTPLTSFERVELAQEIFDLVYREVETFREKNIGADLAYLLGAIVDTTEETSSVDWGLAYGDERPYLLDLFERLLPADHLVWQFIERDEP